MKSETTLPEHLVRLEKYIAQEGLCSRREGKKMILSGRISVNGKTISEPGFGVNPEQDQVVFQGAQEPKQTIAFYKPRGIETVKTHHNNKDIHDQYPQFKKLAPIGRLDKESEGLILLSDDGLIARAVTKDDSMIDKEYIVSVRERVTGTILQRMCNGIIIDSVRTLPAETKSITDHKFTIILREGRKHQIRRMADACRLTIGQLVRVRVGPVKIGTLKPGTSRALTDREIKLLLGK